MCHQTSILLLCRCTVRPPVGHKVGRHKRFRHCHRCSQGGYHTPRYKALAPRHWCTWKRAEVASEARDIPWRHVTSTCFWCRKPKNLALCAREDSQRGKLESWDYVLLETEVESLLTIVRYRHLVWVLWWLRIGCWGSWKPWSNSPRGL